MIKIGMLIADRYEVLEKIGTGGMSDVYKAKDHKLNRLVAVKVLKQEFAENVNFVSKFRVEAQAAAGLMHPNIVNIYDVGEEKGFHYIVMELVEGITLKKYIEKKARLTVKEAVIIAIQVCMGLEAAHANKVIHRDIKPQNIIISKDGKVKVTDFGIAKAATSNTITSNVMGSVHYTSPEQARGGYSDEKSDIYSLGITLFEMLTGRVPFNGETTVAIAIKHIQQAMPSPREFVPEIPRSVEQIVMKCCEKSPDRRYQNMTELIADLKQSLIYPDDDFVKIIDPDEQGATKLAKQKDQEEILRATGSITGEILRVRENKEKAEKHYQNVPGNKEDRKYVSDPDKEPGEALHYSGEHTSKDHFIREYPEDEYGRERYSEEEEYEPVGYPEEQYREKDYQDISYDNEYDAREEDYYDEGRDDYDDDVRTDAVARRQRVRREGSRTRRPGGNGRSDAGRSGRSDSGRSGRGDTGRSQNNLRLNDNPRRDYNDYDDEDGARSGSEKITAVLAVLAAVLIGVVIIVLVAGRLGLISGFGLSTEEDTVQEEELLTVPSVEGQNIEDVKEVLIRMGLTPEIVYAESSSCAEGIVMSSNPAEGSEVPVGTGIELTVSVGTNGIAVPDVTGMSVAEATSNLERKGFVVNKMEGPSETVEKGLVASQNPAGDTAAPSGSTITITISTGPDTEGKAQVPDLSGISQEEAMAILVENGLQLGRVTEVINDDPNMKGLVCGQSAEAGTYVDRDTAVDLQISKGTGEATYSYNADVEAPSAAEDPNYTSGTSVYVVIIAADGTKLLDTTVSSFPVHVSYSGLAAATGTLQMSYTNTFQASVTTDPETGETVQTPGGSEQKVITRNLTFTEE